MAFKAQRSPSFALHLTCSLLKAPSAHTSFNKHLLTTAHVPSTVLAAEAMMVSKTGIH